MIIVLLLSLLAACAATAVAIRAKVAGRCEMVSAVTILWVSLVIVPIYALGLIGHLTRWNLALASFALSASTLFASCRGAPGLLTEVIDIAADCSRLPLDAVRCTARARSPVIVVVVLAATCFVWNLSIAYMAPSWRSWDGIWYHEPIIGFTIQNHGFSVVDLPFDGIQKINGYPRVSEMLGLWFAIFAGRRWIDLPNTLLLPALACAAYVACRRHCNYKVACIGWAATIVLVPAYVEILQSTFNDPALTTFVLCGYIFCTREPLRPRDALFGACALALACNTKILGVFPAMTLCVVTAARLLIHRSIPRTTALATVGAGVLVVAGFSATTYLRNLVLFRNPVWPDLRVDIPNLGIHWPGLAAWGEAAVTPAAQLNASSPRGALLDSLLAAPFTVQDRDLRYSYKYGFGTVWIFLPLMAIAILGVMVEAARWVIQRAPREGGGRLVNGLTAVATIATVGASSTALWGARYNLTIIAIGASLVCWQFRRLIWARLHDAAVFAIGTSYAIVIYWDYPGWRMPLPRQLPQMLATPFPKREFTPEFDSPVLLATALAREWELTAGEVVVSDDFVFPAVLWNNEYSNRVVYVRAGTDLQEAADRWHAKWIYASGAGAAASLTRSGQWETIGALYVEGWGTALRRAAR
jgi:hypothetical protein